MPEKVQIHTARQLRPTLRRNFRFVAYAVALMALHATRAAAQQSLLITELMYAPVAGKPEWVEIHNPGTAAIDLAGRDIRNGQRGPPTHA